MTEFSWGEKSLSPQTRSFWNSLCSCQLAAESAEKVSNRTFICAKEAGHDNEA